MRVQRAAGDSGMRCVREEWRREGERERGPVLAMEQGFGCGSLWQKEGAGWRTGRIHAGQVLRLGRPESARARCGQADRRTGGQATAAAACFIAVRRPARDFSRWQTHTRRALQRTCADASPAGGGSEHRRGASPAAGASQAQCGRCSRLCARCMSHTTHNLSLDTAAPLRCVHITCLAVSCRVDTALPRERGHRRRSINLKRSYSYLAPAQHPGQGSNLLDQDSH
jgi:hypothetical protein